MKKTYILMAMSALLCLTGCDFFRKVAGRPTGADIEEKRVAVARAEEEKAAAAAEQARLDSLLAVQKAIEAAALQAEQDSLAACEYLSSQKCRMYDLSRVRGLAKGKLDHRYYIVIGSFREEANADRYISKLAVEPSLEPVKMHFRTGMIGVGVRPCDKITDVRTSYDQVRAMKSCPKDAWILVNEQ